MSGRARGNGPASLDPETIDAIAHRVVDLLRESESVAAESDYLTATDIARIYGVRPGWVYAHAVELGVVPLGRGVRPRLRFDPEVVAKRLGACSTDRESDLGAVPPPDRESQRPRRAATGSNTDLLPIRGSAPPGFGGSTTR